MQEDRFMELFFELYENTPRQGPGSSEVTRRALEMCAHLPQSPNILDIGCGVGTQSMLLAVLTGGKVTAVDFHQPFLDSLAACSKSKGLDKYVFPLLGDMNALDFPDANFDLLWAEGSVYLMGFDAGLTAWRRLLKPGGYVAVSELSWLAPHNAQDVPDVCRAYWKKNYPAIRTASSNAESAASLGYDVVGHFALPASCWTKEYYAPLETRLREMQEKYPDDETAKAVVNMTQEEMDMYAAYSDYYGYEFYVLRRSA